MISLDTRTCNLKAFGTHALAVTTVSGSWRSSLANSRLVLSAIFIALAVVTANTVARADGPKASVELFTSQGCSSCPPADKLIGELTRDSSIIAMSLAIDYWDYLGWKDTLALKGHGRRQQAYAHVRGDREVYTPQVVVNGVMHVPGGDRAAIERAIEVTRRDGAAMSLPVKLSLADDKLLVEVGAAKDEKGQGEVWLLPLIKKVPVAIERGENRGHTITYSNVVRRWVKLGEWNGKAESYSVSIKDFQNGEIDSIAVMVQKGDPQSPGLMLGANTVSLR